MPPSTLYDPRYLVNIEIGMDVMISDGYGKEENLIPCKVMKKISTDAKVELGVMVECENGKIGRVQFIGEEAEFREPNDLLTLLEKELRVLVKKVLSKTSENWWQDRISKTIQEKVELKNEKYKKLRELLDIDEFTSLEQTDFIHLQWIIIDKKNYSFFKKVFGEDMSAIHVKLSELSHFRNINAHSKELKNLEKQKIRVYFHDITYQIKQYYEKIK